MKLYLVECVGMNYSLSGAPDGLAYVIADSPNEASKKVTDYLDSHNLGFSYERVLKSVTMVAETGDFPAFKMRLFM